MSPKLLPRNFFLYVIFFKGRSTGRGGTAGTLPFRGPRMGGWIRRGWIWRFWGHPQNAYFKVIWDLWTENRGAPKMPNPTTTDPAAHSRPADTFAAKTHEKHVWDMTIPDFFRISTRSTHQRRNHPHHHFGQLTRTMVWALAGRKLGPWSEFPFLHRFTVLLNSGGSNSPWSEFWSEFPHFMGIQRVSNAALANAALVFWI